MNILEGKNDRLLAQSQFALHITSLPISLKKKKMSSFMEEISPKGLALGEQGEQQGLCAGQVMSATVAEVS